MVRKVRAMALSLPHHISETGVGCQTFFFTKHDRHVYLGLLADQLRQALFRILVYCLMSSHIHLVVIPEQADLPALCPQFLPSIPHRTSFS